MNCVKLYQMKREAVRMRKENSNENFATNLSVACLSLQSHKKTLQAQLYFLFLIIKTGRNLCHYIS